MALKDTRIARVNTGNRQVDDAVNQLTRAVSLPAAAEAATSRRQTYDAGLLWIPCTGSAIATGGAPDRRQRWTMSAASPAIYYVNDSIYGSGSMTSTPTLGTRQYTTVAASAASIPGRGFRISCIVTVRNFMGGTAQTIWGKKVDSAAGWINQRQFDFTLSTTGVPAFTLRTSAGSTTITGDYALERGRPYYLEGTYDNPAGASVVRFNVNGCETGTSAVDGATVPWGGGPFYAFNFPDAAAPDNPFAGYLEECLIESMQGNSETVGRTRYLRAIHGVGVT